MDDNVKTPTVQVVSRIKSIDCIGLMLADISEVEKRKLEIDKLFYGFNINFKIDSILHELYLKSSIKIFADESQNSLVGQLDSEGVFILINYDEIVSQSNGIPTSLFPLFSSVMIATSRGFLILKTQGTFLEGAIVPIVDSSKFDLSQSL